MNKDKGAQNTTLLALRAAGILVAFFNSLLFIEYLSIEEFGIYTYYTSISVVFITLLVFGINIDLNKEIPFRISKGTSRSYVGIRLFNFYSVVLLLSLLSIPICALGAFEKETFFLVISVIILNAHSKIVYSYLVANKEISSSIIFDSLAPQIILFISIILFSKLKISNVLLLLTLPRLITLLIYTRNLSRWYNVIWQLPNKYWIKKQASLIPGQLVNVYFSNLDLIIAGSFVNSESLGIMGLAKRFSQVMTVIRTTLVDSKLSLLSSYIKEKSWFKFSKLEKYISRQITIYSLIYVVLVLAVLFYWVQTRNVSDVLIFVFVIYGLVHIVEARFSLITLKWHLIRDFLEWTYIQILALVVTVILIFISLFLFSGLISLVLAQGIE